MSKYVLYDDIEYKKELLIGQTNLFKRGVDWLFNRVDNASTIELTFCKDCCKCKEKGIDNCPSGYGYLYCKDKKSVVDPYDYCSWGKK